MALMKIPEKWRVDGQRKSELYYSERDRKNGRCSAQSFSGQQSGPSGANAMTQTGTNWHLPNHQSLQNFESQKPYSSGFNWQTQSRDAKSSSVFIRPGAGQT